MGNLKSLHKTDVSAKCGFMTLELLVNAKFADIFSVSEAAVITITNKKRFFCASFFSPQHVL